MCVCVRAPCVLEKKKNPSTALRGPLSTRKLHLVLKCSCMLLFPWCTGYIILSDCIYVYLFMFLLPSHTTWPLAILLLSGVLKVWRCLVFLRRGKGWEAPTSLMRAMKRFPKRQGLCRLHCNELTVICWDCCTATATMCTASYMSAASVCKPVSRGRREEAALMWTAECGTSPRASRTDQFTAQGAEMKDCRAAAKTKDCLPSKFRHVHQLICIFF